MDKALIAGIIARMLTTFVGGYLVKTGLADEASKAWVNNTADVLAGAIILFGNFIWAVWSRKRAETKTVEKVLSGELPKSPPDNTPQFTFPTKMILMPFLIVMGFGTGCALRPGADKFLTNAEKVQASTLTTAETVWAIDHENRAFMVTQLPAVHAIVEQSRREFPGAYRKLEGALAAYRLAKTTGAAGDVETSLGAVSEWAGTLRKALIDMYGGGVPTKGSGNVLPNSFTDPDSGGKRPGLRAQFDRHLDQRWPNDGSRSWRAAQKGGSFVRLGRGQDRRSA